MLKVILYLIYRITKLQKWLKYYIYDNLSPYYWLKNKEYGLRIFVLLK